MKIFLPFTVKGIGGTASFALKFQEGMRKQGHEVFFEYQEDYDVLFLIVQAPFKYLLQAKRRKKKIIQRLDGTYYWSVASWKYPLLNLKATIIRHLFADFTIYQSKYSKYCSEKFLGKKANEQSEIIYNGVDLELFSPSGDKKLTRENPDQQLFFTASAFRRKDQILPLLEALEVYKEKYTSNFILYIAGTFTPRLRPIIDAYAHSPNIRFLHKVNNEDLPAYERSADVFLFTHLNPPCPNNILEAMACGLPICGVADGAMREITAPGKNSELVSVQGDAFYLGRNINKEHFADNLALIMKRRTIYRQQSQAMSKERFGLDEMIQRYIRILQQLS